MTTTLVHFVVLSGQSLYFAPWDACIVQKLHLYFMTSLPCDRRTQTLIARAPSGVKGLVVCYDAMLCYDTEVSFS